MIITERAIGGTNRFNIPVTKRQPTSVRVNGVAQTITGFGAGWFTISATPAFGDTVEITLLPDFDNEVQYQEVLWSNTGAESDVVQLDGSLMGIYMPSTFTGTSVTFKNAPTETGTFTTVTDKDGNTLTAVVSPDKTISFPPADFGALRYVKVVSSASETAGRRVFLAQRPLA